MEMLTRLGVCIALSFVVAMAEPAAAMAGVVEVTGSTLVYSGEATSDQIAVTETPQAFRLARIARGIVGAGPGCVLAEGFLIIECTKAGVTSMTLDLLGGDDVAWVGPSVSLPVAFRGGEGNDAVTGGGGIDSFDGGQGKDTVVARDGRAERVDCGGGDDMALLDDLDIRMGCERLEGDADGDGVRVPGDCDDATPAVRPGAIDIPDNGIDEDCSGVDRVTGDRDQDGVPAPQDCDDGDPAIRPGLPEVLGNASDEDCDTRTEPFPPITGSLQDVWEREGARTRNVVLTAKGFPKGTVIEARCAGRDCPFRVVRKRVQRRKRPVDLHRRFGDRALRPGVRVELQFRLTGHIGRVVRYRMTRRGLPEFAFLCLPPGGRVRDC